LLQPGHDLKWHNSKEQNVHISQNKASGVA
jgi:hypothetical protein